MDELLTFLRKAFGLCDCSRPLQMRRGGRMGLWCPDCRSWTAMELGRSDLGRRFAQQAIFKAKAGR